MRLLSNSLVAVLILALSACGASEAEPNPSESAPEAEPEPSLPTPTVAITEPPKKEEPEPTENDQLAEVVYVLMRDTLKGRWFCTGTLVAENKVVTAAHCLDPSLFVSYEVVAPLAPAAPRVKARSPKSFGGHFSLVENPDIGFLTLDESIALPAYGQLTDVVERVEAGEELSVAALVRVAEQPEAELELSPIMQLSSTVQYGYSHGFGTPLFSKGGDSGAGLFLVEDGKPTHKLVGVARQPEPQRDLDHFTRIDKEFLDWFAEGGK